MSAKRTLPWPRLVFSRTRQDDQSGEAGAHASARFRALVMPHLDAAYSYARFLARDGTVAEDIVQDAFLRAWKGFEMCRGSEKQWLLTIVRNCFYDWMRSNRHISGCTESIDDHMNIPGDDELEGTLLGRLDMETIRETINQLPEPFRETLILRELNDLTYREIATLTQAPVGTVMSRLARARDMLGKLLVNYNQGGAGL